MDRTSNSISAQPTAKSGFAEDGSRNGSRRTMAVKDCNWPGFGTTLQKVETHLRGHHDKYVHDLSAPVGFWSYASSEATASPQSSNPAREPFRTSVSIIGLNQALPAIGSEGKSSYLTFFFYRLLTTSRKIS